MPKNRITDEDKALFRSEMTGVKPLNKKSIVEDAPKKTTSFNRKAIQQHSEQHHPALSDHVANPVDSESLLSWSAHSLPVRQFSLLKKGKIHYDAYIDLHGLNRDAAAKDLVQFIKHQQQLGYRCIKVIHGKGGRKGEAPVIKNLINQWLRQLDDVLAFHSCLPADGGTGAVYVLLKRV